MSDRPTHDDSARNGDSGDDHSRNGASADSGLVERVAELADRIASGESVDLDELARNDPTQVRELRRLLPAIAMMADLGASAGAPASPDGPAAVGPLTTPGRLGDFVLVRELGHGGMGVVYEARQISINRRVALKVLPPVAAADPRQLRRFQLEVQAVGYLQNPHIVPVYSVGLDRGVHFFAMLYVEGRSLAEVLRGLRYRNSASLPVTELSAAPTVDLAPTSPLDSSRLEPVDEPGTEPASLGIEHIRWAARLSIQAAEALQHAHEQGVVHRDVKPGNLLIDDGGRLWVTDFGLARLQNDAGVTRSGDILGTLRYMSPEQAAGRGVVLDGRTDVYSLGITLYELLTLRPAFDDDDRQTVLRRIVEEAPTPLRRLNPLVPADLERIVAKATAKEPADRYATAADLAEDLQRFLDHRPVLARCPGVLECASKWVRRHRTLAAAAAALLVLATIGLTVGIVLVGREQTRTAMALRASNLSQRYVQQLLYASDMRLADQALRRGDPRLTRELLDRHRPEPGRADLRDFVWHYLDARVDIPGADVVNGLGPLYCLQLSPDGRLLAVAGEDGYIRLLDPTDGDRTVAVFDSGQVEVNALAFSPDGLTLASAGDDGTIRAWVVPDGRPLLTIPAHKGLALGVAFLGDGARLASCGNDGVLGLWDARSGEPLETFRLEGSIAAMAAGPEASGIALVSYDENQAFVVDQDEARQERAFWAGEKPCSVAFSPDGRLVAVGGRYGELMVGPWQGDAGEPFRLRITDGIEYLAFDAEGRRLFAGDRGGVVRSWPVDPATGRLGAPVDPANSFPPAPEPDGLSWVAHEGRVYALCVPPGGTQVLSAGEDGRVVRWDLRRAGARRPCEDESVEAGFPGLATGPEGLLAVARPEGDVVLWAPQTCSEARRLADPADGPEPAEPWIRVDSSRDGRRVAALTRRRVTVRDARTGAEAFAWSGPPFSYFTRVALSPDGRTLAVVGGLTRPDESGRRQPSHVGAGDESTFVVRLFDVASRGLITTVDAPKAGEVVFSPDGSTVAVCVGDEIRLHRVATGAPLRTLSRHTSTVTGLRFTPDGHRLVSVGHDRHLIVWDPATGEPVFMTLAHRGPIIGVDISPDGRLLATAGLDDALKLWHLPAGYQFLLELPIDAHWGETRVRFTSDGRALTLNHPERLILFDTR